jgi:hypothetical protein
MRSEDLIPKFLEVSEGLLLSREDRHTCAVIRRAAKRKASYFEGEDAENDFSTLFQVLEDYCPPYTYFGAIEGDGACYGIWADVHSITQDIADGCVYRIEDAPKDYRGYVVRISDHGNVALYNRRPFGHGYKDVEIWGVV